MKKFITATQANQAQKLSLYSEDGKEFYLMILSAYSNEFKLRKNAILREAAKAATEGKYSDQLQVDLMAKLAASTIVDWNLSEEEGAYSKESAERLLMTYPEIFEAVDAFGSKNDNFIKKN
jgi:hypothetical protein